MVEQVYEVMKEIRERMDKLLDMETEFQYNDNKMNEIIARYAENKRIYEELKIIIEKEVK